MKIKIAKIAFVIALVTLQSPSSKGQAQGYCYGLGDWIFASGQMIFVCGSGPGSTACVYKCGKE